MAVRLIKWVGDPRLKLPDNDFEIPDWQYENSRVVVIPTYNGTAGTRRILTRRMGFSRVYLWEIDTPNMIIPMLEEDWNLLHSRHPSEFKDVTLLPQHMREKVSIDVITIDPSAVGLSRSQPRIVTARR